jgi:hypothetical protein
LSSVLDCDRRSDVFTWDPVVEIQKGENCGVSTKELFLRDEGKGNFEHKRGKRDTRPPQSQSLHEYHLNHHPFIHQHPPWKLRIVVYPRQFLSFFLPLFGAANPKCSCERKCAREVLPPTRVSASIARERFSRRAMQSNRRIPTRLRY